MSNEHAILSASSSSRWMACTPSARLELEFADYESVAAKEGTAALAQINQIFFFIMCIFL